MTVDLKLPWRVEEPPRGESARNVSTDSDATID